MQRRIAVQVPKNPISLVHAGLPEYRAALSTRRVFHVEHLVGHEFRNSRRKREFVPRGTFGFVLPKIFCWAGGNSIFCSTWNAFPLSVLVFYFAWPTSNTRLRDNGIGTGSSHRRSGRRDFAVSTWALPISSAILPRGFRSCRAPGSAFSNRSTARSETKSARA